MKVFRAPGTRSGMCIAFGVYIPIVVIREEIKNRIPYLNIIQDLFSICVIQVLKHFAFQVTAEYDLPPADTMTEVDPLAQLGGEQSPRPRAVRSGHDLISYHHKHIISYHHISTETDCGRQAYLDVRESLLMLSET